MPFSQLPETSIVFPLDIQSLPVPGSETPGYTPIYRNAAVPEIHTKENTYDAFAYGRNAYPKSNCLGWRPWNPVKKDFENTFKWWTYEEVEELRTALGSALVGLQKKGEVKGVGSEDWVVALWMQNRPEYQVFDQATAAYTLTTVALYDSYDTETSVYVLSHSEAKVVATTSSHLSAVLSSKSQLPHLDVIVLLDESSGLDPKSLRPGELSQIALARQWGALAGVKVYTLAEMLENGRKETLAHNPPLDNNKIASLCYTSGTTGKPKGAFVAHRQLALAAAAVGFVIKEPQLMLSYLPLAHIYERALETVCLRTGSAIGYFSGDTLRLIEDAQILKPTFFPSVPRVLNRIAAQVQAQADGEGLKAKLLRHAIAVKVAHHDATGEVTHAFYDRLVFSKVQAVLGGRVKIIISGSAPIRPDVLKLLRVCLAADVREGYGQTENAGLCLIMNQWDPNLGSCGPPVVGTELRLKDCPELGYTAADKPFPRGEILSRGQATFPGYYKDPEKTAETLDSDGWLHSGDVGLIDQYGRIKIIDRVKNLVKLSQGEYVAIENVEGLYGSCPLVAQLWLYGDSLQAHLVAIAVPEPSTFAPFASKVLGRTIAPEDIGGLEAACADPKVIQAVIIELAKVSKKEKMKGYEYIRALKLRMDPFTLENGLLTPTFKMKRPEAKKILKADLDALYAQEPADVSVAKL